LGGSEHANRAGSYLCLDGFISYCGAFEIRENEHIMIHHPDTAWSPNYPGTVLERPYRLVNRLLFLPRCGHRKQKDGTEVPVIWTITWERLK